MKAGLIVAVLVFVAGPAAQANRVQPHPATPAPTPVPHVVVKPVAKPLVGTAIVRRPGTIGGPVSRWSGINGTNIPRKLSKK
jgi:hypothetical protein